MKRNVKIICVTILVCYAIVWCVGLSLCYQEYNYAYPTIQSGTRFLFRTLCVPAIPLCVLVLATFTIHNGRKKATAFLMILFVPVMAYTWIQSAGEILYAPSICSYTSDPDKFRQFDQRVEEDLRLNPVSVFPVEIPQNAQNIQYSYYHEYASAETTYIALSFQIADERIYDSFVLEYVQLPDEFQMYNSGNLLGKDRHFKNSVLADDRNNQIAFVISTCESLLPEEMEEVFKEPSGIK